MSDVRYHYQLSAMFCRCASLNMLKLRVNVFYSQTKYFFPRNFLMFPCLLLVSLLKNYKAGHFWIKIYGISQQKRLIHAWINHETVLFINRRLSEVKSIKVISTRGEHFEVAVNLLHPNISIHNLYTVFCTFGNVLTRRICLTIKSFFSWWSFPLFSWH